VGLVNGVGFLCVCGVWVKQRTYFPLVSATEMAIFGKLS